MMANSYVTSDGLLTNQPAWNARVASYLVALHAYQEYRTDVYGPAASVMNDVTASVEDPPKQTRLPVSHQFNELEAESVRRRNAVFDMLTELIAYPSPKLSDLLTKMEIAKASDVASLIGANAVFEHMIDDVRRLINSGAQVSGSTNRPN